MFFTRYVTEAAAMFTAWADVCVLNRSPAGLRDNATLAALVLGVLVAELQGGEYVWLLLVWGAFTFVFGVAFTDAPHASYRLAAAMPALFILAACGAAHLLVATAPSSRWYRLTVRPAMLLALAAWVGWQNYHLFFIRYANGDGHETIGATELRFMGAHCDGRVFYAFGSEPQGAETELFCTDVRMLSRGQLPSGVDVTRPATFFVADGQRQWLDTLRHCYPGAASTAHVARDGRTLFTRIDVPITALIARGSGCAG